MKKRDVEEELERVMKAALAPSGEQEEALWADFRERRAEESAAWAAFAAAMVLAGSRLRAALPSRAWPRGILMHRTRRKR